jgi:hypothetical protein
MYHRQILLVNDRGSMMMQDQYQGEDMVNLT